MRLDLKENVVFPFSDPEWAMKLLKTSLCYLLIAPIPAVMGYQLAVIRETANVEDEKLPEFGPDFGNMWVKGFIFGLLMCLVAMVPMTALGAMGFGGYVVLQENSEMIWPIMVIGFLLLMAFCLLLGIVMPALMLRYAMTDSASSLFDVRAAFNDIKQGPADYALIVLFPMLASIVTSMVTATGIGAILVLPLTVLTMIIQSRMLGNYYRAYFH